MRLRLAGALIATCVPAAPIPAAADGVLKKGDWAAHGFAAERKAGLRAFVKGSFEHKQSVGGALLLAHRGEVIFEEGFGYADLKTKRPFLPDTPCRIASISKPIVATLLVRLAARGELDLEAPVDRYLPEFKALRLQSGKRPRRMPKVRELLSHTAGFTPDKEDRPWLSPASRSKTLGEMVGLYASKGLYRNPGGACRYSGTGYDVAGRILEVVTGKPLESVLQAELCRPLGLKSTTFYPGKALRKRAAERYWLWRSDLTFHRNTHRSAGRDATGGPPYPYTSVGGAVMSTARELAAFLMMHRNRGLHAGRRYVAEDALRQMYEMRKPWPGYGMGFVLRAAEVKPGGRASCIHHSGSSGTLFWLDFEHDLLGVVVTQTAMSKGRPKPGADNEPPDRGPSFPKLVRAQVEKLLTPSP